MGNVLYRSKANESQAVQLLKLHLKAPKFAASAWNIFGHKLAALLNPSLKPPYEQLEKMMTDPNETWKLGFKTNSEIPQTHYLKGPAKQTKH